MSAKADWDDRRIEQILGNLLRIGVSIAAVVVLIGGALYLNKHGASAPHYRVFRGEPSDLRSVRGILADVTQASGRGVIQFGLLLLIATPVARVLFSLVGFALERDRLYIGATAIVLVVLLYSLFSG